MTTKLATAGFLIFATLLISAMATPQFEKQLSEDIAATEQSAAELVADLREDDDADSMSRLAEEDQADETAEESLQKRRRRRRRRRTVSPTGVPTRSPTRVPTPSPPALRWTPTPTWLCGGRVVAGLPGSHALVLLVALKDSRSDISMQALHDSARMAIRVVE